MSLIIKSRLGVGGVRYPVLHSHQRTLAKALILGLVLKHKEASRHGHSY